mgnify:CR=1 FL=1
MKKPSEVFKNIRFAKMEKRGKPHLSTDDEEHGAVGEVEWNQQLDHQKKRAMQEKVNKPTGELKDACWKGYTAVGMKMKDGKKVPNCVPTNESADMKAIRMIKDIYKRRNVKEEVEQVEEAVAQQQKTDHEKWKEEYQKARKSGSSSSNAKARANGAVYEEEQIDELSKETLTSYRVKSIGRDSDFENKGYAAAKGSAGNDKSDKLFNKADAVSKARKRAQEKLREDEQIEEEIAGWIAHYNGQKHEIKKHEAKDLYDAKQKAIAHFKAPKSKHGLVAVKPAYNESVELEEGAFKRIATDKEEDARLSEPPFDKPYTTSKGTVTDKSGAKHSPMSRARDLARQAVKKQSEYAKARKAGSSTKNAQARAAGANNPHMFEARKAEIVKDIVKSAKKKKEDSESFQKDPELGSTITKNVC